MTTKGLYEQTADDSYSVLQLRMTDDTHHERYASMRELKRMGLEPNLSNYEAVYTAPLRNIQAGTACWKACI